MELIFVDRVTSFVIPNITMLILKIKFKEKINYKMLYIQKPNKNKKHYFRNNIIIIIIII